MNPIIRRRLPSSVRTLLTDIGSKEEWIDAEPESVTKDGIVLPSRGAVSGEDELLMPAQEVESSEDGSNSGRNVVCMFCKCKPSCYTCPRCNLQYCGLVCYQSAAHSDCSEAFYKESVLEELKDMGKAEGNEKKKMQEVLVGLKQMAERTDGGMGRLLKEAGIVSDEGEEGTAEKVQVVDLLSRLADFQKSGEGSAPEIEAILRELAEIGDGDMLPGDVDEDDEHAEGGLDLAERFSRMDVDNLSEEELWEMLDGKEKEKFIHLMKSGAIGGLVPLWKPWWEEHNEEGRTLVEEVGEVASELLTAMDEDDACNKVTTSQKEAKTSTKFRAIKGRNIKETSKGKARSIVPSVPPISSKIPKLSSLCANPSPLICYSLVNALFGYTFTLCLFNGDTNSLMFEFCDMILALSEALSSSRVFSSVQEALDCGDTVSSGGYLDKEDPLAPARAMEAVAHVMTGKDGNDSTGYCLAALSQLRSVLSQARSALSKEGEEGAKRQKYFLASKKCEFFQAWVLENAPQIGRLAHELWTEQRRRQSARNSMEKAKTVVEENLKKGKMRANCKLIEEVSQ